MLKINDVFVSRAGRTVLDRISLEIDCKGIYGILGVEGAGKTVLAEIICGCRDADGGEVTLSGETVCRSNKEAKSKIRLVPTELCVDSRMTVAEYLSFVGEAINVGAEKLYRQIKEAVALVELSSRLDTCFFNLSAAERCRLALASSLLGNPEYIVLDDPFSQLEKDEAEELYGLVELLSEHKSLVLISSDPTEAETLCEKLAIIGGGKVALCGRVEDIKRKIKSTCEMSVTVRGRAELVLETIEAVENVLFAKVLSTDINDVHLVSVEYRHDPAMRDKLFAALHAKNMPMLSVREISLSLEDIFRSLTADDVARNELMRAEDANRKSRRSIGKRRLDK